MTKYSEWKIHTGDTCPVPAGTMGRVLLGDQTPDMVEVSKPEDLAGCNWSEDKSVIRIFAYQTVIKPVTHEFWAVWYRGSSGQIEWDYNDTEEGALDCLPSSAKVLKIQRVTYTEGEENG